MLNNGTNIPCCVCFAQLSSPRTHIGDWHHHSISVLCTGEDGSISDIVDSGRVLVFPSEASREVKGVFQKFISSAKRFLTHTTAPLAAIGGHQQQQCQPSADGQPLLPGQWQSMTSALLSAPATQQQQKLQQLSRSRQLSCVSHRTLQGVRQMLLAPATEQAMALMPIHHSLMLQSRTADEHFPMPSTRHVQLSCTTIARVRCKPVAATAPLQLPLPLQ